MALSVRIKTFKLVSANSRCFEIAEKFVGNSEDNYQLFELAYMSQESLGDKYQQTTPEMRAATAVVMAQQYLEEVTPVA